MEVQRMPAYIVADLDVIDSENFEIYKQMVPATIEKFGGRYIVRGGNMELLEGVWMPKRFVILEFPSVEKAKAWYGSDEYSKPKAVRQSCAKANFVLVQGV
jgi:uncharacterized protein (DUF1330 family)